MSSNNNNSSIGDELDREIEQTTQDLKRMGVSTEDICSQFHELSSITKPYHFPVSSSSTNAKPDMHHHLTTLNDSVLKQHATNDLHLTDPEPYIFAVRQNEKGYASLYTRVTDFKDTDD